jgi:aminoglycoside/choline kinase family phosphotransferase
LLLKYIQSTLNKLYKEITGLDCSMIEPIPESGSPRKYYRLTSEKAVLIGAYNPVIEENETFFSFAQTFRLLDLPVPEVLSISSDRKCYVQTDLGNISLFDLVQKDIESGNISTITLDYYKKSLNYLIQFQISAHQKINYSMAYPIATFDATSVLFDLEYFKYYFLKLHPQIIFNERLLQSDFQNFTAYLLNAPSDYFMYRDFQSRNILIHNDQPYFIDFQGGRKGPLQYDLVSLLYQAKARIAESTRNELKEYYLNLLEKNIPNSRTEFEKYYEYFVFLRLFQVLGAYGYRGLIQKKPHFIASIPHAISTLKEIFPTAFVNDQFPELTKVLEQILQIEEIYLPKKVIETGLKIIVSSFSYLKTGIPADSSGNGGGFVFDCRALPNPGREVRYRMLTGKDSEVITFLEEKSEIYEFQSNVKSILTQSILEYQRRGFSSLAVNFGCTGGQHRSVYMAETSSEWIKNTFPNVNVITKHIELQ